MYNVIRVQHGPTLSIVTPGLWQTSIERTPLAQGIFVPIFGATWRGKPLT